MRTLSIAVVAILGLTISVTTVMNRPAATALAADERQPSIMIDQLTANAKGLPVQSFDAF
jgi:hypothetical protein